MNGAAVNCTQQAEKKVDGSFIGSDRAFWMHIAHHSFDRLFTRNEFAPNDKIHKTCAFLFSSLSASRRMLTLSRTVSQLGMESPHSNIHGQTKFMHFACERRINRNFNWFSHTHKQNKLQQNK